MIFILIFLNVFAYKGVKIYRNYPINITESVIEEILFLSKEGETICV